MANEVDLAEVKKTWVGFEFDRTDFEIDQKRMLDWANACGEKDPRFTDPEHAEFQAHPSYTAQFVSGQVFPEDFPKLGPGWGFDGGKCVEVATPVRAGDTLTAKSLIADIYEKTGRSGTMIFIVHRMVFTNQKGEPVSTVDWRLIQKAA